MKAQRTFVKTGVSTHTHGLSSRLATFGSCFAEAIGARLTGHKINTLKNPFGVIYNPHSIHKAIKYAIFNEVIPELTFVVSDGIHLSYDLHSSISGGDRPSLRKKISEIVGASHHFLKDTRTIILTYGTAWVYERVDTGEIVANCHKMPSKGFGRFLLTQRKIIESFNDLHAHLKSFNPDCSIVLSVSPVRHIRDTLEGNGVSKAILRTACHTLSGMHEDVEYFPGFEIMIDDLRDYRYYKRDMIHPTEEAEDYIWDVFVERYFDTTTQEFFRQWSGIRAALSHRPFHPESVSHQLFLRETLTRLEALREKVHVEEEINLIRNQLK